MKDRKKFIVAIDQGTTSSRAILFNTSGVPIFKSQLEFKQYFPNNGWVEHNPEEIWKTTKKVLLKAINRSKKLKGRILTIGITNQRETVVMWDKTTGEPVYNAIVWQCRRTKEYCDNLNRSYKDTVYEKTGLYIDSYFSASKIKWIFDNIKTAQKLSNQGNLLVGTIDTWIIWNLTGRKNHVTEHTNACRTMLFNINSKTWDKDLLKLFNVSQSILPEVKNSMDNFGSAIIGACSIPIEGVAGDQQALQMPKNVAKDTLNRRMEERSSWMNWEKCLWLLR